MQPTEYAEYYAKFLAKFVLPVVIFLLLFTLLLNHFGVIHLSKYDKTKAVTQTQEEMNGEVINLPKGEKFVQIQFNLNNTYRTLIVTRPMISKDLAETYTVTSYSYYNGVNISTRFPQIKIVESK